MERFFKIREKMCEANSCCYKCKMREALDDGLSMLVGPMSCLKFCSQYPREAAEIAEQWEKEHPKKTIIGDFVERTGYRFGEKELLHIIEEINERRACFCPDDFGYIENCNNCCSDCWSRELEAKDHNTTD